jgi:transposase-like protein
MYRAVDKAGATVDFPLTAKWDCKGALRFLRKVIKWNGTPEKITIDKSGANTAAIEHHNAQHEAGIEIRQVKYLNNIIEQIIELSSGWYDRCWGSSPSSQPR